MTKLVHILRLVPAVILLLTATGACAFAAGLNVPLGSTLNINTATLTVPGDVTNAGTLVMTTGTINLTGNWTNSGTFTAGTGTVNFVGTSGTQTLTSGGTGAGKYFYHLMHSQASTLQMITNPVDINANFTNSSGTFNANGLAMSVASNWSNTAAFLAGGNTVTLDGGHQSLIGMSTFYTLLKSVTSASTLTFDNTGTQTVTHSLTLQGASGQLLSIRSDAPGSQANLTLQAGGTQTFSYLDVQDSDASGGITLVAGPTSVNSGNNINWLFGGTTVTWNGIASTDWDTLGNWDLGFVPGVVDTAVIPNVANQPILASVTTVDNLAINSGAALQLAGNSLTVSTALTNNGTLRLWGSETVSVASMNTNAGTVVYTGDGDFLIETFTIAGFGTTGFYNLTIDDNHAMRDIFRTNANLNVAGNLEVTSGTLDISTNANTLTTTGSLMVNGGILAAAAGNIDANGAVNIASGTLTAPGAGLFFTVAGGWTKAGGAVFDYSSGTVTFDGAGASTIAGSTTFNDLTCSTPGKQLTFTAGTTQTVLGVLTLAGSAANDVTLRSSSPGSAYTITDSGTETVSFVDVQDSTATNSITAYNSVNFGNNVHWVFSSLGINIPVDGKTVGQTPTVIGIANAADTVTLKDKDGTVVATTTADANGNFRVAVSTTLALGTNSLTPYVGSSFGATVNLTVVATPTAAQVPTINIPIEAATIKGGRPTVSGTGNLGSSVTLMASDANGNLLLTSVATAIVDALGNYTITSSDYSVPLVKGGNSLSVTVEGVASTIRQVTLVDPYGVVFDSVSNSPVQGATVTIFTSTGVQCVPGVHLAATDTNPQTTGVDGAYSFLPVDDSYYVVASASGYVFPSIKTSFPSGRTIVTGSKGEVFPLAGQIVEMDFPMDINQIFLKVLINANKKEVSVGDIVTYTVTIQNPSAIGLGSVYLHSEIPAGFKYMSSKAILDNAVLSDPTGSRSLDFNIGTIAATQQRTLKYQLVVGSGVTFGKYENTVWAMYLDGTLLSNRASETVSIVPSPLFDLGTVIGKVFLDQNKNGIQDSEEGTVANAQIVTEEGTVITTDKDGKFHWAAVQPGRHVLRLDERTLLPGAYLTTDKAVLVDIRPGLPAKVNFGVALPEKLAQTTGAVSGRSGTAVLQERTKPAPRLNVALYNSELMWDKYGARSGPGRNAQAAKIHDSVAAGYKFVEPAEFRIFTNYASFIDQWKLEILDKDTKAAVQVFDGNRSNLLEPIFWDGTVRKSKVFVPYRSYVYRLSVTGKDGRTDTTQEKDIKIIPGLPTALASASQDSQQEKLMKSVWLQRESAANTLVRQNIKIDGEMLKFPAMGQPGLVRVMRGKKLEAELPAQGGADLILPVGEYDIEIVPASPSAHQGGPASPSAHQGGPASPSAHQGGPDDRNQAILAAMQAIEQGQNAGEAPILPQGQPYRQHIKIGEDYLFFVGMGDAKMGYTFLKGHVEPLSPGDKFNQGFWSEGKMAYYLKGKIKGKYLVTSSLDTERDKKELFKSLDPDKYYPIYGDASSVNYSATNTQGPLYLLVEWDKSSALWGNYNTGLTDTEFAAFNRSLYGGKLHYESVATTRFGEPRTKLIVFRARARQKASHNEFLGTGGSLFYLEHKDVVEGSGKIKIEVRDKITGLVLATKNLQANVDYDLDEESGRLLFWQPVSQLTQADTIISSHLLNGNPVYVVADYEYAVLEKYDQATVGGRVQKSVGDYVSMGGTYVQENQLDKNYQLKGADVTLRAGEHIRLTGEFAESVSQAMASAISTDGGLHFTTLSVGDAGEGQAFGLKTEARLFDRLSLTSYYKNIGRNFSSVSVTSQQGKELMGMAAVFDLTPQTRFRFAHDIQELLDEGNAQTQAQVGAQRTQTTTAQVTQDMDRFRFIGEYRSQKVEAKKEQFVSETNTEADTAAARIEYKLTDKTTVGMEHQATIKGESNRQTSAMVETELNKAMKLRARQTVGSQGLATSIGASANVKDRLELTSDYTRTTTSKDGVGDAIALGGKANVDDKTQMYASLALASFPAGTPTQSLVFGSKRKVNDDLEMTSERTYAKSNDNLIQAKKYGLSRQKDGRHLEGSLTTQETQGTASASRSNIFGLSGDINEKWAAMVNMERGEVQNLDGTQTQRNAGTLGLTFVNKNPLTQEVDFKASSKLELRFDQGQEDVRQIVAENTVESKVNPDMTLFAKANLSQTQNTTTDTRQAQYKEFVTGVAYRPVRFDRLNLLGKYTYLEDDSPASQADIHDIEKEKAHVLSAEGIYDLNERWQFVEKIAHKFGEEQVSGFGPTQTQTTLWINRVNYNFDPDWQMGAEYRLLTQKQARDSSHGALVELARKIGDYVQVGVGYNFTEFNDDLTHLDYTAQGPFLRLTGKVFDRTPEEIERARQRWLDYRIQEWAWALVNKELAKAGSSTMQTLHWYIYLAEKSHAEGHLEEARDYYDKVVKVGDALYKDAEEFVRNRIELEKKLIGYNDLATSYYKEGKLEKAKQLWQRVIQEVK